MSIITDYPKTLVVFTSYPWESALAYLRFRAPAEMAGWKVLPGHDGERVIVSRMLEADMVLFQRDVPRLSQIYQSAMNYARQYRKPIIYETDDWLFGVPEEHPFQDQYVSVLNWMLSAVMEADKVIASTLALQHKLGAFRPDTELWPNYLPDNLWHLRSPGKSENTDEISIGYMGTVTHLPDLKFLTPVLHQLIENYGNRLKIKFFGLRPPDPLCQHKNVSWQVENMVDYQEFVRFFMKQSADIWLAPLQDNEFNRCKSALKFLEYSALGEAGVYSRVEPYQKMVVDGQNGFLAATEDEWFKALKDLIDHPEKRYAFALEAQNTLQTHWLLSDHVKEWQALYQNFGNTGSFKASEETIAALEEIARQVEMHLERPQIGNEQLNQILASRSWQIISKAQRLRESVLPPGGRRERLVRRSLHFFRKLRHKEKTEPANDWTSQDAIVRYENWLRSNEPDSADLEQQKDQIKAFRFLPLISIITPVFNPQPEHLKAMIRSVQSQTYPHWELCLADGKSSNSEIQPILEQAADVDDRIKVQFLKENLGISVNSNSALSIAQGDYVAFVDHDDTLAPFSLFEIVQALNRDPELDLIYSDHDLMSEDGTYRFSPLFKPDWSPEIMLSANYITHLTVIRKSLIDQIGGFQADFDGAQDWDLFFRIVEKSEKISHIPKVLYHWRDTIESTSRSIYKKQYAPQAQLRAIQAHLQRNGFPSPAAYFDPTGFIRVKWAFVHQSKVSIIIPSNGVNELLKRCVHSIRQKTRYANYEVIIVNNGAKMPDAFPYYEQLTKDARFRVVHDDRQPFNYAAVNNWGASHASSDVLVFLNNDTEVLSEDWLDEFVMWTSRPDIGAVGAKLLMPDKTIQHAGVILGLTGFAGHVFAGMDEGCETIFGRSEWYRNYLAMTAACLGIRRSIFEQIGGFNEKLVLCGNDVELCFRVRDAGFRNVYHPFIKLLHEESATREGPIPAGDYRESYQCYQPFLRNGDPFYNPNLSMWNMIPDLRDSSEISPEDFAINFLRKLDE